MNYKFLLLLLVFSVWGSVYGQLIEDVNLEIVEEWSSESSSDLPLAKILSNYYQSNGGLASMDAVQSLRAIGKITLGETEYKIKIYKKNSSKTRVALTNLNTKETIILGYNGELAWRVLPNQQIKDAQLISQEKIENLINNAPIFSHLYNFRNTNIALELSGRKLISGLRCYEIKASFENKFDKYYYIDANSYEIKLIRKIEYKDKLKHVTDTILSDTRKNDKFTIAYNSIVKVNGIVKSIFKLDTIEFGVGIFENYFDFPGKRSALNKKI